MRPYTSGPALLHSKGFVRNPAGVRRINRSIQTGTPAPYRAVDADGVHGRYQLVAGDLRRSVESADPRAAGVIAFVGVNLGIQYRHEVLHGTEYYASP